MFKDVQNFQKRVLRRPRTFKDLQNVQKMSSRIFKDVQEFWKTFKNAQGPLEHQKERRSRIFKDTQERSGMLKDVP